MRIAVIGSGISGSLVARLLSAQHEVDVFESSSHVGGHAHTQELCVDGRTVSVDTAFMVFNERTYPNFVEMLGHLAVDSQDSDMSFSVHCERTGLEYQGSSLNGLFAQRKNFVKPGFHRMLIDIVRFHRLARRFVRSDPSDVLLGEFLDRHQFGRLFTQRYLVPMSAAIWSADPAAVRRMPASFILAFLDNHGLLQLRRRPQWKTITGGSRQYVRALLQPLRDRVFTSRPVASITRHPAHVKLEFRDHETRHYDQVVVATHADQALQLIVDADKQERSVLQCFPYQRNSAILHADRSFMPKRKAAWASWNYRVPHDSDGKASVTYDLNRLQRLGASGPLCVTLNPKRSIDQRQVMRCMTYAHPVFSSASLTAQRRFAEISGRRRTHFCGAYWGYGFHEDGVNSALAVAKHFGIGLEALSAATSQTITTPGQRAALAATG
jgi:predicted NAD/FAD-binding protein